jgi:hypothetical protein
MECVPVVNRQGKEEGMKKKNKNKEGKRETKT